MTLHAIPVAGAFSSNSRRALTTGITMYRKFLHVSQKPSKHMNRCIDAAFAYAVGDLLLRSLMSVGHSSSMTILSKALRTWRSRSIMMKFVAKRVSTSKRMDKSGDNLRNMAYEAWWLLMKTEMILAFFTNFFTHFSLPQSSRRRSKQCAAHPCTYRWEMD